MNIKHRSYLGKTLLKRSMQNLLSSALGIFCCQIKFANFFTVTKSFYFSSHISPSSTKRCYYYWSSDLARILLSAFQVHAATGTQHHTSLLLIEHDQLRLVFRVSRGRRSRSRSEKQVSWPWWRFLLFGVSLVRFETWRCIWRFLGKTFICRIRIA